MVRVIIPTDDPRLEKTIDLLIEKPMVRLPDSKFNRKLGRYIKPLKDEHMIDIYWSWGTHEKIGVLRAKSVKKINGRGTNIEYLFDDLKIELPVLELP